MYCIFVQVGVLLGGDKNTTRDKMKDIIEFETRLARITVPAEDRRDEEKFYNNMAIAELQELAPFVRLFYSLYYSLSLVLFIYQHVYVMVELAK